MSDWIQGEGETVREDSDAVIRRLVDENKRLRDAIKPFVAIGEGHLNNPFLNDPNYVIWRGPDEPDGLPGEWVTSDKVVTYGDFHRLVAASKSLTPRLGEQK